MYKLKVEVKSRSEAKILGHRVREFLVGEQFSASFSITNIGDISYPGGNMTITIPWLKDVEVRGPFVLPTLGSGERTDLPPWTTDVFRAGFGLFLCEINANGGGEVEWVDANGNRRFPSTAIGSVNCQTKDEIYTLWALIVSTASVCVIVIEKLPAAAQIVWSFLQFIWQILHLFLSTLN
jgi:hypothetical protein